MITFALAVLFLIITPGPGVLSTAGVGAAFGRQAGLRYVTGLWVGTNLVSLIIVTGLAAIMFSLPVIRTILIVLSTSYLFYLAARIGLAHSKVAFITASSRPGFSEGVFLQFINPKAYAVNSALFSSFAFMPHSLTLEVIIKFAIMNLIWIPLHLLWLEAGVALQKLSLSQQMTRRINYAMAGSLLIVVSLSVWSFLG